MNRDASTKLRICIYIAEYYQDKGFAPSYREIMDVVKLASPSTIHGHIKRLKRDGYITSIPETPRTIVPEQKLYDLVNREYANVTDVLSFMILDGKIPSDYSDRLLSIRLAKHMSREELAFRSGVSYVTLCAHERGTRRPRMETYKKYAKILGSIPASSSVS